MPACASKTRWAVIACNFIQNKCVELALLAMMEENTFDSSGLSHMLIVNKYIRKWSTKQEAKKAQAAQKCVVWNVA